MAWNEPGKGGDKDPWGSNKKNNNDNNEGPPDLDEMLRELRKKVSSVFGGGRGGSQSSSGDGLGPMFGSFLLVFAFLYAVAGFYIVDPAEKAAVFQFGKYIETVGPGPHWIPRFVRSKQVVNVEEVSASEHQALMLTKDQNIVSVALSVQYKIGSLKDYLFSVKAPEETLAQVTDSALRQVIGHSNLDDILTSGREEIRQAVKKEIVRILSTYKIGLDVVDVPMQPAKAPDEVKEAFDDAIKAQEDEIRSINHANAYRKKTVPVAEGQAQRRIEEASAYKQNVILQAEGDAERFLKLLPEYKKAPKVTRQRLYLDAMQSIYGNSSKVFVDSTSASNQMFYIPLDKLLDKKPSGTTENLNGLISKSRQDAKNVIANVQSIASNAQSSISEQSARWRRDVRSREQYER